MTTISLHDIQDPRRRLPDTRNVWQIISAAPHRMMFAGGLLQLLIGLIFWAIELAGRYGGLWPALPTSPHTTWAHALLMVYSVFPFFIFGFLMTTYPRWMREVEIPSRRYVPAAVLMAGGALLADLGLFIHVYLFAAGLGLFLLGWAVAVYALIRVYLATNAEDTRYETLFNLLLAIGWVGLSWGLVAVLAGNWLWLFYAVQLGLWGFLLPLLVGVGHRMIPFFSSAVLKNYPVYRPFWIVPTVFACSLGHAWVSTETLWAWRLLFDLPLLGLVLYLSWRWQFWRAFSDRLLAVLHVSFLWLVVALLLFVLQSLWQGISGQLLMGKAPLHALTIGFMLSLLMGMASRVILGHSGRFLLADALTWYAFWGLGLSALLRMAAEIPGWHTLNLAAGLLGLSVVAIWCWRYLPVLWRPRVDGKPG